RRERGWLRARRGIRSLYARRAVSGLDRRDGLRELSGRPEFVVSPPKQNIATVAELLRWADSRLAAAELHFGHGTDNPSDEAAFIVLEALGLPIDRLGPVLRRRVSDSERLRIVDLVEQ